MTLTPISPTHKKTIKVIPPEGFQILKTERRHALPGEYITPYNKGQSGPPIMKVEETFFEEQFLHEPDSVRLHTGTGYVKCENCGWRIQYYEYVVITKWRGDIERAMNSFIPTWALMDDSQK